MTYQSTCMQSFNKCRGLELPFPHTFEGLPAPGLFFEANCEFSLAHCRGGRGSSDDQATSPISKSFIVERVKGVEWTMLTGGGSGTLGRRAFEPSSS